MKYEQLTVVSRDTEFGNVCFWDYFDCTIDECVKEFLDLHDDHTLFGVFCGENLFPK